MTRHELNHLCISAFPAVMCSAVVLGASYCVRHWDIDVFRVAEAHRRACRSIGWGVWTSLVALFMFEQTSSLYGLLPLIDSRASFSHAGAAVVGLLAVVLATRAYESVNAVGIATVAGGVVFVSCLLLPKLFLSLLGTTGLIVVAFRSIRVIPWSNPPGQYQWIRNLFNRGAWVSTFYDVQRLFVRQLAVSSELPVYFGFLDVPMENVSGHFIFAGAPGTGKTIGFRLLMQSVLPRLGDSSRAILYDAKHEQVSVVQGMGIKPLILNPFDARCMVWDLAQDFHTPSDAHQLAKLFLPEPKREADPFWRDSARGILADVILAHILSMREGDLAHWSLSDLMRSLQSRTEIDRALSLHPRTKNALRNIGEERTLAGILATLDLVRREFEVLGALWDVPSQSPERMFSLNAWFGGGGVLILGPSTMAEQVLNPLNRLLLDRVGQLVLDSSEQEATRPSRTWLFLDEFPRLGRMPRIESIMTNGRSKGLVAVLGLQDVSDLRQIYGEHQAATILGCCSHRMLFQAGSKEHAEWCVQNIGGADVVQLKWSFGWSHSTGTSSQFTRSSNLSSDEKSIPLFTRDQFRILGKPGIRTPVRDIPAWIEKLPGICRPLRAWYSLSTFSPIQAVCSVQNLVYEVEASFRWTLSRLLPKAGKDFVPRPTLAQFLASWEDMRQPELEAPQSDKSEQLSLEDLWKVSRPQ